MELNRRAHQLAEAIANDPRRWQAHVDVGESGGRVVDLGVRASGGLTAGLQLARVCLADLAEVALTQARPGLSTDLSVSVATDHPLAACMASQYAGWQIASEGFFAMGSGPMRALYAREALFEQYPLAETADVAVGVLESSALPPAALLVDLAAQCRVVPDRLTLLVAPTASLAGNVQVVARSVETALHKLHELGFDLRRVVSGWGVAPLPPPAADDLAAIGRTNDAILYGGEVTLWMRGDDASLQQIIEQTPSCASRDFGRPFAEIFARYDRDFYQIDPLLFSPAMVRMVNLDTGRTFCHGELRPELLAASFA